MDFGYGLQTIFSFIVGGFLLGIGFWGSHTLLEVLRIQVRRRWMMRNYRRHLAQNFLHDEEDPFPDDDEGYYLDLEDEEELERDSPYLAPEAVEDAGAALE